MKNSIQKVAMPALLALTLLSTSAWAQNAAAASQAEPGTQAQAAPGPSKRSDDPVEKRIRDLRSQLKITDQQSPQWDAFAQTMRDNAQKTHVAFHDRTQKLSSMNADDAMDSYADLAQLHADNMKKLASSMRSLYGVLTSDQKSIADSVFRNDKPKQPASGKPVAEVTKNANSASLPLSK